MVCSVCWICDNSTKHCLPSWFALALTQQADLSESCLLPQRLIEKQTEKYGAYHPDTISALGEISADVRAFEIAVAIMCELPCPLVLFEARVCVIVRDLTDLHLFLHRC